MTVRELMAELAKVDPEKEVFMAVDTIMAEIGEVSHKKWGMSGNFIFLVEEGEE